VRSRVTSATVSRLPVYLRTLAALPAGQETCSSDQLATLAGVNSAQVRKDLSFLGSQGTRGVGYRVDELRQHLRRALGLTHGYSVVIVGAGNLGTALGNYAGFGTWGFEVVGIVDADPRKVGTVVAGITIEALDDLEAIVTARDVSIGIIATPSYAAQDVADRLTAAGLRSILNFAPAIIDVPDGVEVRRVDLSTELQILTYHLQQR
jgi:redox-sensing transcriptional repressor